ncbi:hypothetical protein BH10PLA2_BH10PLA2_16640 [soil metagenome]
MLRWTISRAISRPAPPTPNTGTCRIGARGYQCYLMTMAKCLDRLGVETFEDTDGVNYDWRADMVTPLASRQRKNGSWANETDRWRESNPDLCTACALITLSYCKPKTK